MAVFNFGRGKPALGSHFKNPEARKLSGLEKKMVKACPTHISAIKRLMRGYDEFVDNGVTPGDAYQAFRELYWRTRGLSNRLIGEHVSRSLPKDDLPPRVESLLGSATAAEVLAIVRRLRQMGFYRFPNLLPGAIVDAIKSTLDEEASAENSHTVMTPELGRTTFEEAFLLNVEPVVTLAGDPLLRHIASEYLQTSPVLGFIASWISRAHENTKEALSSSAQMFHFDMSNPNFLKVFLYLDDVTEVNGPHCVVPGSNYLRDDALWRDGRISDDEIKSHYPEEDWAVLTGSRGSMFVVDTSAFHKGCPIVSGQRHILQFYYVDTLFGEHVSAQGMTSSANKFFGAPPRFSSRLAAGT
jgi:hypothetical protein